MLTLLLYDYLITLLVDHYSILYSKAQFLPSQQYGNQISMGIQRHYFRHQYPLHPEPLLPHRTRCVLCFILPPTSKGPGRRRVVYKLDELQLLEHDGQHRDC